MQEIEINLSGLRDQSRIEHIVEGACTGQGLQVVMKGSLKNILAAFIGIIKKEIL